MFVKLHRFNLIFYIKKVLKYNNRFMNDINLNNPLGSGGKLVK